MVYTPDSNQANNILPWMLASQNGGLGNGLGGWAGAGLGFLFGLLFGNGSFGGFGGGNGAGFLSNQIDNGAGREMLMNAITSNGEASRAAISNLSTMLGQDFNQISGDVRTLQSGLSALTAQTGMSALQIINAIQSGDSVLGRQLCECCCENRLLTTQQGYESQIRTLEQTNQLGSQADRNANGILGAIAAQTTVINEKFCDLEKRELQGKIDNLTANNALLRSQIDNANQTAAITGYINNLVSPIAKEVDDIKCKLPNTVSVTYPNLYAVNATPYVSGGFYQGGFNGYYGSGVPGFGGNITF